MSSSSVAELGVNSANSVGAWWNSLFEKKSGGKRRSKKGGKSTRKRKSGNRKTQRKSNK